MPMVEIDPVLNGDVQKFGKEGRAPVRYDVEEKCEDEAYAAEFVEKMEGKDFTLRHVQKEGFDHPVVVKSKAGLHMKVPRSDFDIRNVRACVGSSRQVEVKYIGKDLTQTMTAKEFHKRWHRGDKDTSGKPTIVGSLEFSHTRLENFVKPPLIVRQLDWDERVWPRHLKLMQTESSNEMSKMMHPKVQKMAVMSARGGFTDFRINPGGASSWHYVSTGRAVVFLVPPSYVNHTKFMEWASSKQSAFFGDEVDKCGRIVLERGQTFFLPAGWIHAIFTPEDTLIFGGNFLHSFSVKEQLEVAVLEQSNKVPEAFCFPFLIEMLWYALERYVHVLTGKSYICGTDNPECPTENKENEVNGGKKNDEDDGGKKPRIHVTKRELLGLKAIIVYIHRLPPAKKVYPSLITDPAALVTDLYHVVTEHEKDDQELAVTGKPVLLWPEEFGSMEDVDRQKRVRLEDKRRPNARKSNAKPGKKSETERPAFQSLLKMNPGVKRYKRQRCKICAGCKATNCRRCEHCKDMTKYGGVGRLKQSCIARKCLQMMLPNQLVCDVCEERNCKEFPTDPTGSLFECMACGGIAHGSCLGEEYPGVSPMEVNDLKKQWVCHKCASQNPASDSE